MTAAELVQQVRRHGVELVAAGDRIRYRPRTALPTELRAELAAHKPEVLQHLHAEQSRGRWNPLVPDGWTPEAWRGRLTFMARICIHHDKAVELQEWAEVVASVHGLDVEGDP